MKQDFLLLAISEILRQKRNLFRLSVHELALSSGVPDSTVTDLESGQLADIDLLTLRLVIDALGLDTATFMALAEKKAELMKRQLVTQ